jgi:hypothetical protein
MYINLRKGICFHFDFGGFKLIFFFCTLPDPALSGTTPLYA